MVWFRRLVCSTERGGLLSFALPWFRRGRFPVQKNFLSIPPMKTNRLAIGCVMVLLGSTNMSLHGQTGAPPLSSLASLFFLNS
jgi:hypothetical protein